MTIDFSFRPESPTQQTWRYRTSVLKSHTGVEHRHSLTDRPRQTLKYDYLFTVDQARWLKSYLFNNQGELWRVPVWHEEFHTTVDVSSGLSITGDFTDYDYTGAGRGLIVSPDDTSNQPLNISSVSSTTITLLDNITTLFPAGSGIFPVFEGYITGHSFAPFKIGLVRASITFQATSAFSAGGSGASLTTYQSKQLLVPRPLDSAQDESFDMAVRRVDNDLNHVQDTLRSWADIGTRRQYYAGFFADLQYWEALLDATRGGWKSLFVPTWRSDLNLRLQPGAGGSSLVVEENPLAPNFNTEWFDHPGHLDLQIHTDTDGPVYRRVTLVVDNGDNLTLSLDSALPSTSGLQVTMVSFLELSKLSDSIGFRHFDGYSIVSLTTRSLQQ